jgi:hypothetical protein
MTRLWAGIVSRPMVTSHVREKMRQPTLDGPRTLRHATSVIRADIPRQIGLGQQDKPQAGDATTSHAL